MAILDHFPSYGFMVGEQVQKEQKTTLVPGRHGGPSQEQA